MFCISDPYVSEDNKLLSSPFRFIGLPLYCALLFILFWFVFCPLMFVKVRHYYLLGYYGEWPNEWPLFFWTVALLVFLILVGILVLLWKLSPKNRDELMKVNYIDDNVKAADDEKRSLLTVDIEDKRSFVIEGCRSKPMRENHKCVKPDDLGLELKETKEVEDDGENTPMTPRELFFRDLIENADKSFISSPTVNQNVENSTEETTQEFFVANVSVSPESCVSNIFMFVNADDANCQNSDKEIAKDINCDM